MSQAANDGLPKAVWRPAPRFRERRERSRLLLFWPELTSELTERGFPANRSSRTVVSMLD